MTDSQMTHGIVGTFYANNLAVNAPSDLAPVILAFCAEEGLYGKGVYVEGGRNWEIEEGIVRTMPEWLGEGPTRRLWEGLGVVGKVSFSFFKVLG
jgi:hypothetical protein